MLELVDGLRSHASASNLSFILFQPPPEVAQSAYEEELASLLTAGARERKADITVALVGNVHAMRQPPQAAPDLKPMAMFLPSDKTLTFNVVGYFGSAWSCRRSDPDSDLDCRAWALQEGTPGPRRLVMTNEELFDGRYSVGGPFTASPPAREVSFPDSRLRDDSYPLRRLPALSVLPRDRP